MKLTQLGADTEDRGAVRCITVRGEDGYRLGVRFKADIDIDEFADRLIEFAGAIKNRVRVEGFEE